MPSLLAIRQRSFRFELSVIVAVGAAWRLFLLSRKWDRPLQLNDSLYYSAQATDLAHGFLYREPFTSGPGAEHVPLTSTLMALVSWGDDPIPWQRVVTVVFGIATVAVLGLLGRAIGGPRVGLVAAAIAALYPNLWIGDGLIMSESISICIVAIMLLLAVRWCGDVSVTVSLRRCLALGAVAGLGALARSELVLMIPMFAVLVWRTGRQPASSDDAGQPDGQPDGRRRRGVGAALVLATAGMVLAPWLILNLTRFERPVLLSTNDGTTLAGTYNDDAFYGREVGGWSIGAIGGDLGNEAIPEPSVRSERRRDVAIHYLRGHLRSLPRVVLARVGRTLDLYGFRSLLTMDKGEEKSAAASWAGIVAFWVLAPLAFVGMRRLDRRRRRILLAPVLTVLVTTVVFYGAHRIRSSAEPTIVIAAAVSVCWLVDRWRERSHAA